MRKIFLFLGFALVAFSFIVSCDDGKTYAEMMEEEKKLIENFMKDSSFVVLDQFPQDTVFGKNEFYRFDDGLHMNIIDRGSGASFEDGMEITVRFTEINLSSGVIISNMKSSSQGTNPDVFRYQVSGSSKGGTFIYENDSEYPLMMTIYSSSSVPAGWLEPLDYLKDGASVKLIVPHKLGQSDASYYVYPCYYEIQYGISKR